MTDLFTSSSPLEALALTALSLIAFETYEEARIAIASYLTATSRGELLRNGSIVLLVVLGYAAFHEQILFAIVWIGLWMGG